MRPMSRSPQSVDRRPPVSRRADYGLPTTGYRMSSVIHRLLFFLVALLAACTVYAPGPVPIDTTSDTCARCRMSVDSLAHAAEIITDAGDIRKYDSLGCLLDDYRELSRSGRRLGGTWVVDYNTKEYLKAENAYYALADLPTDHMGFGAAAAASRAAALKIAGNDAAKVVDWKGLLAHR